VLPIAAEYTIFFRSPWNFFKIDHILGQKASLNNTKIKKKRKKDSFISY
jgi:hypothetical protein